MLNQWVVAEVSQSTMLGNILVVTGAFLILLLLIKKFAWTQISDMLQKRQDKIANDLDSAEKSKIEAAQLARQRQEQLNASRSEASDILKSAKESGEKSRQNILTETKDEVSRLRQKAQTEIDQQKQEALASVKDDVADLSVSIAAKLLQKELSADAHKALIDQYITGLGQQHEAR